MTLNEIVEQLRMCNYECEGGMLVNNVAFRDLEQMALSEVPVPVDDIVYLTSTISIVHHRHNADYADREALLKAARVDRWLKSLKGGTP